MTAVTIIERDISRTITTPPPAPGFAGPGHTAVPVVDPSQFVAQDPFIVLMDDRLDLPEGAPVGGEHPHAGFEIATFVLEGSLHDRDEGVLREGDVQWMLAGRGVIHNEHVVPSAPTRILQLWLTIPESERWSEPRFETITREAAAVRREPGVEARVYSGSSGGHRVRRRENVPISLVDIRLGAGATFAQDLPATYNGFAYVLEGDARVGAGDGTLLRTGQVGWLDRPEAHGASTLRLTGGEAAGARLVLYAGEPQHLPIVLHGPFVGGTRADLMRVSRAYASGEFERMSALVRAASA